MYASTNLVIIGSDKVIVWISAGLVLIGPLGSYFSDNHIKIQLSINKINLKNFSANGHHFQSVEEGKQIQYFPRMCGMLLFCCELFWIGTGWFHSCYRKISNIRCTKSQNLNVSHFGLLLSLGNMLKQVLSGEWRCIWSSEETWQ